jgi:ubiquinone/menaquinone biosynthesis C-methylase UbiE
MEYFDRYASFFDLDYQDVNADLYMIQSFAARCGSPILELGCGTGRVLLPLAQAGYRVTGVDSSPAMLEIARTKAAAGKVQGHVTLIEQDMKVLSLDQRFNLAYAVINSFAHLLSLDDQLACLYRVHDHLLPGGLVVLDLMNPDMGRLLESNGQVSLEKVIADPERGHNLMKFYAVQADVRQQILHVTIYVDEIDGDGRVHRSLLPYSMRYLFPGELEMLLRSAGFQIEAIYGSYDLDELTAESDRMIAVAQRLD